MEYRTADLNKYIPKQKIFEGPLDVLPEHFCGLIIGPPGSGKTSLVVAMLKSPDILYKKFDLTLFISPYPIDGLNLQKDRLSNVLSLDWIKSRVAYFSKMKKVKNVLVFIDDSISQISKSAHEKDMLDLFFNRRKIVDNVCISLLITSQKFSCFHSNFRSQCDFYILFHLANNNDMDKIAKELSDNPNTFKTICKSHWSSNILAKPFIYLRKKPEYKLFLNFEQTA